MMLVETLSQVFLNAFSGGDFEHLMTRECDQTGIKVIRKVLGINYRLRQKVVDQSKFLFRLPNRRRMVD